MGNKRLGKGIKKSARKIEGRKKELVNRQGS